MAEGPWSVSLWRQKASDRGPFSPSWPPSEPPFRDPSRFSKQFRKGFSVKFASDPFLAHIGDASSLLTRVDCLVAERLAPARVPERGKERRIMAAEDEVRQASERFYAAL